MTTTYFWRFGRHEVSAVHRAFRGFIVFHDGIKVAQAKPPLFVGDFRADEDGRSVAYRVRLVKAPFPYGSGLAAAEIERNGVHVVGTR